MATATCGCWPGREVQRIAVHPESRRLGLGRKMMDAMVEYAIREGAYAISLEVRKGNLAAGTCMNPAVLPQRQCEKAYYHNPTEDALIMWKRDLPGKNYHLKSRIFLFIM